MSKLKLGRIRLRSAGNIKSSRRFPKVDILKLCKEAYEEELAPLMPSFQSLAGAKTSDS